MWRQTVAVQAQLSSMCWKIRAAAVLAMASTFGAASLAWQQGATFTLFAARVEFASSILFVGLIVWSGLFCMDRAWYHQLLQGATKHREHLEQEIADPRLLVTPSRSAQAGIRPDLPPLPHYPPPPTGGLSAFYWGGFVVFAAFHLVFAFAL
ncbi:hypothetical protein [Nocardiopsis chromatogenes]|uniref:hypothetical protein n=1 Tax=Nocardiopsis chromatogenes TaxID=280239 RepID=UPI0003660294|nr:hypothetical protein [Nocardiopsis chromatogenes]